MLSVAYYLSAEVDFMRGLGKWSPQTKLNRLTLLHKYRETLQTRDQGFGDSGPKNRLSGEDRKVLLDLADTFITAEKKADVHYVESVANLLS